MSVDMSPEGVTARLYAMGDLWELTVALLDAKKILPNETDVEISEDDDKAVSPEAAIIMAK
ncbi:MAG: hypothetical protein ACKVQJ_06085 [Pyrinomonadaceae bacterium]